MRKKVLRYSLIGICVLIILLIIIYVSVSFNASGRTYDNVNDVPCHQYGLLLGTSPYTAEGARNFYFENRIKSAAELYKAGKIKKIIVSGGDYTRQMGYDEPKAMSDSLYAHGVHYNDIIRDYEGTRTINSVVKAKENLGYNLDSVIIISQKYHNERAIAQADKYGLIAVGFNAPHSHIKKNQIKNILREFPARVKLYYDLWFGKKPEFFYEAIEISPGHLEDWYYDPSCPVPYYWTFRSSADRGYGFFKVISSDTPNYDGNKIYYNSSHGYTVVMPKGMGLNQWGENMIGGHGNEFYNNDTTLVLSTYATYYDVVLVDIPNYADSLRLDEWNFLRKLGNFNITKESRDVWMSEGMIDHNNPDNPPADRFLRKWVLKKDLNDRECMMELTIYFQDSLQYRLPEFQNIIAMFPDKPILNQ